MAGANISQNLIPNEPELRDLLNLFKKEILLNLNCHHIGTIQTFDPTTQKATATINYKKTFFKPNPITGVYDPVLTDYPILIDCPVICLGGGLASLRFPIITGDECLVLFNDRDIDNWFAGGGSGGAVATPRLHSFSDGIILVGLRSLANVLPNYNASAFEVHYGTNKIVFDATTFKAELANGTTTLELSATGTLKVTNAGGELIAALLQLFTDVQTGLVTTMLGPQPLVMPTFAVDFLVLQGFLAV